MAGAATYARRTTQIQGLHSTEPQTAGLRYGFSSPTGEARSWGEEKWERRSWWKGGADLFWAWTW